MKTLIRILLLVTSGLVVLSSHFSTPGRAAGSDFSTVDAYIAETMRRLPIPGLSLGIVQGSQVRYLQGYGIANQAGDAVTPQTPFPLASITKSFTALAIHQLSAAGKLYLDSPVQRIIPEFRLADETVSARITIRHLLDHTSGISTNEGTQPYVHSPNTRFAEALTRLDRFRPRHQPGENYEYSNWNYVLLGEVVARASGQPYAEYVEEHILKPLEMSRATFEDHHAIPDAAEGNLIVLGFPVPYDEPHVPVMLSAGYLTASVEDMVNYLIPYLNQGRFKDQSLLSAQGQGWYDANWNWQNGLPGDISFNYSGAHNSINTCIQFFPHHQVGVVVLMNTRLDTFIPGPTACEIAFNLARITIHYPYELPSSRIFYGGYALFDGFLVLMVVAIVWQAGRLKGWVERYTNKTKPKQFFAWLGIGFDLLVALVLLAFPSFFGTDWATVFSFRPEFSIPLLVIATCLALLAGAKLWGLRKASFPPSLSKD